MILKFNKFFEKVNVGSDVQKQVDRILDKMIDGKDLSDNEKTFLKSFKDGNQEEYFDTFKEKLETGEVLDNIQEGELFYITLYSSTHPGVQSTKEVYKINDNKFELNSTVGGWQISILDKEKLIQFIVGEIDSLDLEWE